VCDAHGKNSMMNQKRSWRMKRCVILVVIAAVVATVSLVAVVLIVKGQDHDTRYKDSNEPGSNGNDLTIHKATSSPDDTENIIITIKTHDVLGMNYTRTHTFMCNLFPHVLPKLCSSG
ncbi:unnamed protein product, partial [Owenia fusiformis]